MTEVPGSTLTSIIFLVLDFLFSCIKASEVNIAVFAILSVCEKVDFTKNNVYLIAFAQCSGDEFSLSP